MKPKTTTKTIITLIIILALATATLATGYLEDFATLTGNTIRFGFWQSPELELTVAVDGAIFDVEAQPGDTWTTEYNLINEGIADGELSVSSNLPELQHSILGSNLIRPNPFEAQTVTVEWGISEEAAHLQGQTVEVELEFTLRAAGDAEPSCIVRVTDYSNFGTPLTGVADTWHEWGEEVTVTAKPSVNGRVFSFWMVNGEQVQGSTYTFRVNEHKEILAVYNG